jgi:hypothetical protein
MFNLVQGPFGPVFGQANSGAAAPVQTAPTITTTSLPAATVGVAYSAQLAATGNPSSFTWLLTSGNKPGWLTVSTGGALSGTPQAGDVTTGINLTFSCSNGVLPNANSGNLSLVVGAAGAATVVTASNLEYVGAFRLPSDNDDGMTALAYDSAGNGGLGSMFFAVGRDRLVEMSIPALVNTTNIASLNRATTLQTGTGDIGGGVFNGTNVPGSGGYGGVEYHGLLVDGSDLIISAHHPYGAGGGQTVSHIRRSKTLSNTAVTGPKNLLGASSPYNLSRLFAGYMSHVPGEWQSMFGGRAVTGLAASSIVSTTSDGPSAASFDPTTAFSGGGTNVTVNPLVAYPDGTAPEVTVGNGINTYDIWTWASACRGVAIPNGTRSIVFFGNHGYGRYGYGTGTSNSALHNTPNGSTGFNFLYDPTNDSNGEHAYPYRYQFWSYDLNQVAEVRAGTRQPHACTPTVIPIDLPFEGTKGFADPDTFRDAKGFAAGCYAPDRRLIFIAVRHPREDNPNFGYNVVHAFRVNNAVVA